MDEDGKLKNKADMFTKRTIKPERRVTSVDTPSEALAISIGERGKVDLPFMAQLLGTPEEYDTIKAELQGVIFKDPMGPDAPEAGWQTADEYLSGNVRSKLRIAEMAAKQDSSFIINVEALQRHSRRTWMHRKLMYVLVLPGLILIIFSSSCRKPLKRPIICVVLLR